MPEMAEVAFVLPADGEPPFDDRMLVRQRHGRVVIVGVPPDAVDALVGDTSDESITASRREDLDDETWSALDDSERLALEAFWLRQSDEYRQEKEQRPGQGASWDHPDFTRPDPPGGAELEAGPAAGLNERLRGSVALGLVIVSGPGDLVFTSTEAQKVVAEVQSGLSWLGSRFQLAPVTFDITTTVVTITTPANPNAPDLEALWRDPAMAGLGYRSGTRGVTDYAKALKAEKSTDSAYVSFFTHYDLEHFAYARPGVPEVVMQYENDNWGPSNIDAVFAHETGHIFGAPDEYAGSDCDCGGAWGYYGVPNLNCAKCAGYRCIMNANSWTMCAWTPRHVGAPQWWVAGDNYTASTPFVVDDVIYYQGTNDKLYRISNKGTDSQWLSEAYIASPPFVVDGVIYSRGTNDKLYRLNIDGTGGQWLGYAYVASSPFVVDGVIYSQGTNDKLYRINTDGTDGQWLGYSYTSSSPFVVDDVIYFRGRNDKLYRINTDGTGGQWIGNDYTSSTPFVTGGVVFYRGTNDKLYRVNTDGTGGQWLGESYLASTPFVVKDVIYFQGTNDKLYRINTDGTGGEWLGCYISSAPFVADDVLYFQNYDDDKLWMINLT